MGVPFTYHSTCSACIHHSVPDASTIHSTIVHFIRVFYIRLPFCSRAILRLLHSFLPYCLPAVPICSTTCRPAVTAVSVLEPAVVR